MPTDYSSVAAALVGRQKALYTQRGTLWRRSVTVQAGVPTAAWTIVGTNLPFRIFPSPSNFGVMGDLVQAEQDNIFTLDILDFPAGVDVNPGDVLKTTTAEGDLTGAFWTIRGDKQPLVWRANLIRFISARNSGDQPWAGTA